MQTPFQFFDPDFQNNPYPSYARMREEGLSRIEPGGFFALSRYADVVVRGPATLPVRGRV